MSYVLRKRRRPIAMLITCIVAIFATHGGMASEALGQVNSVMINMLRLDDPDHTEPFSIEVGVSLEGISGVTDVTVTSGGGVDVPMDGGDDGHWYGHVYPPDLDGLNLLVFGTWQIAIDGSSPSTSTFIIDDDDGNALLQESDFFATPTGLFPPNGSIDIPADVVFLWNDPTGTETADALYVVVDSNLYSQEDDSLNGSMDITDTSWDPPLDLDPGDYRFFVGYVNIDAAGLVGSLNVLSGSITWGNPPEAPPWYAPSTPMLVLGSETDTRFSVPAPCPADLNGDDIVNVTDLLALIGAWGACPFS